MENRNFRIYGPRLGALLRTHDHGCLARLRGRRSRKQCHARCDGHPAPFASHPNRTPPGRVRARPEWRTVACCQRRLRRPRCDSRPDAKSDHHDSGGCAPALYRHQAVLERESLRKRQSGRATEVGQPLCLLRSEIQQLPMAASVETASAVEGPASAMKAAATVEPAALETTSTLEATSAMEAIAASEALVAAKTMPPAIAAEFTPAKIVTVPTSAIETMPSAVVPASVESVEPRSGANKGTTLKAVRTVVAVWCPG